MGIHNRIHTGITRLLRLTLLRTGRQNAVMAIATMMKSSVPKPMVNSRVTWVCYMMVYIYYGMTGHNIHDVIQVASLPIFKFVSHDSLKNMRTRREILG